MRELSAAVLTFVTMKVIRGELQIGLTPQLAAFAKPIGNDDFW